MDTCTALQLRAAGVITDPNDIKRDAVSKSGIPHATTAVEKALTIRHTVPIPRFHSWILQRTLAQLFRDMTRRMYPPLPPLSGHRLHLPAVWTFDIVTSQSAPPPQPQPHNNHTFSVTDSFSPAPPSPHKVPLPDYHPRAVTVSITTSSLPPDTVLKAIPAR